MKDTKAVLIAFSALKTSYSIVRIVLNKTDSAGMNVLYPPEHRVRRLR